MDPFELLKADHKKVADLFDRLESATGKAKLDVFKQIKVELELHTHIEETIFYPALEKPEETHDLTLEAYEEHKVVKTLLAELSGAKTADDEWQAKTKVLKENVEHHVEEEENELFDKANDALSDEKTETLGNRMAAEKARKQGRPAPRRSAANNTREGKASKEEPGLLTKIADFVGLGGKSEKRIAKKSPVKKTASRRGSKSGAKGVTNKTNARAASATSKRSAKKKGSKAAAAKSFGSRKSSSSGSAKKAKKK
ncbi:MAG TPA: hemerythrin domain-containing protein [Pyrinomonadaceae bacterium]|nr:hemerythrin domain-containing protein [Pyrinomonadaceae bacterium]